MCCNVFHKKTVAAPAVKENRVDELAGLKARLAAAENQNKALVARVAVLENVVKGHGQKIEENDESWKGYSSDMGVLRDAREAFNRENDKEISELKSAIKALGTSRAPKMNSGEIRKQLAAERKRREKIANEKAKS